MEGVGIEVGLTDCDICTVGATVGEIVDTFEGIFVVIEEVVGRKVLTGYGFADGFLVNEEDGQTVF